MTHRLALTDCFVLIGYDSNEHTDVGHIARDTYSDGSVMYYSEHIIYIRLDQLTLSVDRDLESIAQVKSVYKY